MRPFVILAAIASVSGAEILLPSLAKIDGEILYYRNQRGSTLNVTLSATDANSGSLTGTFATAVAAANCQEVIGVPQPVSGTYAGNSVSFATSFADCGTTVAYAGNFDKDQNLNTLWILSDQATDVSGQDFESRSIGSDNFKKQSQVSILSAPVKQGSDELETHSHLRM